MPGGSAYGLHADTAAHKSPKIEEETMPNRKESHLYHGGHKGAEAEFGRVAEQYGVRETTISFEGHQMERAKNVVVLSDEELAKGRVSMEFVFQALGRRFATGMGIRRVIKSQFQVVVNSNQLFAVGVIQEDGHVKGGTGWGVELAKMFNRQVHVFDQEKERWFTWQHQEWEPSAPTIAEGSFSATGTRNLTDAGKRAISELFASSKANLVTSTEAAAKQTT
jgi:hypothetical protein